MKPFDYAGSLPASKSLAIRALFLRSFENGIDVVYDGDCDDISAARQAISRIEAGEQVDCKASGTVFRFALARASRISGEHRITGTPRLMSRPHEGLIRALEHLGVTIESGRNELLVKSRGWQESTTPLMVARDQSSQYLSALVMASVDLEFPIRIEWSGDTVSDGYARMSIELAKQFGLKIEEGEGFLSIAPNQKLVSRNYRVEPDLSAAFAIVSSAIINGRVLLEDFPLDSLQPDAIFVDILRRMGGNISRRGSRLRAERGAQLRGIAQDLAGTPDLFPVLSVMCALAEGQSVLYGAHHLRAKESNRIHKILELIRKMGRSCRERDDGIEIEGVGRRGVESCFEFSPDEDHRMAMAAGIAKLAGLPIRILNPEVVSKSFPGFFAIIESSMV